MWLINYHIKKIFKQIGYKLVGCYEDWHLALKTTTNEWLIYALSANKQTKHILSWFPVFHFTKNVKYTGDRKFIKVHVCNNLSKQNRFDKVIAKIKPRNFFAPHGISIFLHFYHVFLC